MKTRSPRLARLRDLALLTVTMVGSVLGALLVSGWVWFRPLFKTAFGDTLLPAAGIFGAIAAVAGLLYVLSSPPCLSAPGGGIRRGKGFGGPDPEEG